LHSHSSRKDPVMSKPIASRRACVIIAAFAGALAFTGNAWAHATISPLVAKTKALQQFTLAVPTEKEGATTTKIELIPPAGVTIDSFSAEPGWTRAVKSEGSGEEAVIQDVNWSGGSVPTEEDSVFHFVASLDSEKTYTFVVKQTYSDGTIVDWSGPEGSDTPAVFVEGASSLGGGGGSSSTLAIVALVVAGVAILLGIAGLLTGKRSLT
jgi:uncharacterized protein YcnI